VWPRRALAQPLAMDRGRVWLQICLAKFCKWLRDDRFYEICFFLGRALVWYIQLWLTHFWADYHQYLHMSPFRCARDSDGSYTWEGIRVARKVRFSTGSAETLDIVEPAVPSLACTPPVVFVHGGAFVAVNSEVVLHSVGFLARAGYTVYSLDYPLAPEHKFPAALLSVLRALSFLKSAYGVDRCILMGDSAGGCIVAMAAALLHNQALLQELQDDVAEPLLDLQFPTVDRLICVYSILDQSAPLEGATWIVDIGLKFIFDCYRPRIGSPLQGRFTIDDVQESIHSFPKSLLIGAEKDPVFPSTLKGYQVLRGKGFDCTLRTYPGIHGFLGFPPSWTLLGTKQCSSDCVQDILAYLRDEAFPATPAVCHPTTLLEGFLGLCEVGTCLGLLPLMIVLLLGPSLGTLVTVGILLAAGPLQPFLAHPWPRPSLAAHGVAGAKALAAVDGCQLANLACQLGG